MTPVSHLILAAAAVFGVLAAVVLWAGLRLRAACARRDRRLRRDARRLEELLLEKPLDGEDMAYLWNDGKPMDYSQLSDDTIASFDLEAFLERSGVEKR